MHPVEVRYRGRRDELVARGGRLGDVVGFRWGFTHDGVGQEQLSFLLVSEDFLLAQPVLLDGGQRGWWYCDLVTVEDDGAVVTIQDLYIDILVGPPTAPYRLLDLDELAAAVTAHDVDPEIALRGLQRCQTFLDRRLNRRHGVTPTWPDFPPAGTEVSLWASLPRAWEWRPAV